MRCHNFSTDGGRNAISHILTRKDPDDQSAGFRLRQRDQFGDGSCRQRGIDCEDWRRYERQAYRHESRALLQRQHGRSG